MMKFTNPENSQVIIHERKYQKGIASYLFIIILFCSCSLI